MFKVELFCMDRKYFFFLLKDISSLHRKTGHENMKCPEKTGCLVTSPFFFFFKLYFVRSDVLVGITD